MGVAEAVAGRAAEEEAALEMGLVFMGVASSLVFGTPVV
jgi:predicted MFS family arabinose efflux permease